MSATSRPQARHTLAASSASALRRWSACDLVTHRAVQLRAEMFAPRRFLQYPRPNLPGRIVAHVLGVTTREVGDPMAFFVVMKSGDGLMHVHCVRSVDLGAGASPAVRGGSMKRGSSSVAIKLGSWAEQMGAPATTALEACVFSSIGAGRAAPQGQRCKRMQGMFRLAQPTLSESDFVTIAARSD